ncbi:MAG: efflux RND transporter permease subunit [Pirellulaceae bacterium]
MINSIKASNLDVSAQDAGNFGHGIYPSRQRILGSDGDVDKAVRDIEDTVIKQIDAVPMNSRRRFGTAGARFSPRSDYNGSESVGGVVVMRYGQNPRNVIDRVHQKIRQIEPALHGVKIKSIYDRTGLINETMATLSNALLEEILITSAVILLFLLHVRSSLTVAICLPVAVLMAFIAMRFTSVDANIMSLAGIAIAIGTMVDMGIIVSGKHFSAIGRG